MLKFKHCHVETSMKLHMLCMDTSNMNDMMFKWMCIVVWSYFSYFILLLKQKNLHELKKAIAIDSKMAVILSFLMFK